MHNNIKRNLTTKANIRGIIMSIYGSVVFSLGEFLSFVFRNGLSSVDNWLLPVIVFLLIAGIVITLPFTIGGGIWLASDLYKKSKKDK